MIGMTVCSGIGAPEAAAPFIDWRWHAEIEPFPAAVLVRHHPTSVNLGDITKFKEWPDATLDVLVGGTPCQSFSVAGLRGGLADPRGNLALTFLAIADRYRPRTIVWENVPGVLSSNGGRDFGAFLGALGECGYGWAYRVLDAQFFGVAQRRRRVFVVGCLGDWRRAAEILSLAQSLRGHPAPRRETSQISAGTIDASAGRRRGSGMNGNQITYVPDIVPQAMSAKWSKGSSGPAGDEVANLVAHAIQERAVSENPANGPDGVCIRSDDCAYTLEARTQPQAVAFKASHFTRGKDGAPSETAPPLSADADKGDQDTLIAAPCIALPWAVRRLTPTECERLQGFPDQYTAVQFRGKPAADGPRYRALGNSMAVPVLRWLLERVAARP